MKLLCVEPKELKDIVIKRIHARKLNVSRLADEIGESRQTVWNWVNEVSNPQNPGVWQKMADVLEISYGEDIGKEMAMSLALKVLEDNNCSDEARKMALDIVREISKKYLP